MKEKSLTIRPKLLKIVKNYFFYLSFSNSLSDKFQLELFSAKQNFI